jgi:hypothetical protein
MNAKDAIKSALGTADFVLNEYVKDLSDAELLLRPVEGMNHIAWQLGHLVCSEQQMISALGHAMPELPAGFAERHGTEQAASDDRARFASKDKYLGLLASMHRGTLQALDATPEADLDKPGPESMRSYAPTVGAVFNMIGPHILMHAGQFVAVRRKLGKPIVI